MSLLPQSAYSAPRPGRAKRAAGAVIASVVVLGLLASCGFFIMKKLFGDIHAPEPEVCAASDGSRRVVLQPEQMHYAALIAGVAVRKELGPRGATIALATAMQESSLHNLDYGDRDSVGLFQQRPSQGWGTADQIQDPYFASVAFYKALVKVPSWDSGDVNDVAQEIQRSGVPDGYRKHVEDATTLASVFTGQTGGTVTCLDRSNGKADGEGLVKSFADTFGAQATYDAAARTVTVQADTPERAWVYALHATANTAGMGITRVLAGSREWSVSGERQEAWRDAQTPAQPTTVVVGLRGTS